MPKVFQLVQRIHLYVEYKSIRRIRQEYSTVHEEYEGGQQIEPITMNFRPKPKKIQILTHLPRHDQMGKKPSHATVPLKGFHICVVYCTVCKGSLLCIHKSVVSLQTLLYTHTHTVAFPPQQPPPPHSSFHQPTLKQPAIF